MGKPRRIQDVLATRLFAIAALCAPFMAGVAPPASGQQAPPAGGQAAAPAGGQVAAPAGGQTAAPTGGQAAAPTGGQAKAEAPSTLSGVVLEKETKETKESKEIKDHPSDLVEVFSAVAWPGGIVLLVLVILLFVRFSRTIQQLFGIAISAVQRIEIAGVKLEIDTSVVAEVKKFVGGSLENLMKKAKSQYDRMARHVLVQERLADVVRTGLRQILAQHGFATRPDDLRATIHVPDIVFRDYMYQLVDYYPNAYRAKTAGRRLSQRFGIVGRAWRLRKSMGRGRAVSGPDASNQLIMYWGMQPDEADDHSHHRPATLCVMLIDPEDNDTRVGLLYIDSTAPDAFGVNPPPPSAVAAGEVVASAARQAAEAVVQEAADVAAQEARNRTARAAAKRVVQAAKGIVEQAVNDAVAQAANAAANDMALVAAEAAATAIATATNVAAAREAPGSANQVASAIADATNAVVQQATTDAVPNAAALITADQVAKELQNHDLTKALARVVGKAMAPLRGAGPELEIKDLHYANE
jgi:hypothetical protein